MINSVSYSVPTGTELLSGHQLSCIRQDRVLFQQLEFGLNAGQLLHITGKNGAGKSSLLRILAGLAVPDEGHVQYAGLPLQQVLSNYAANLCYIGHQSGIHEQLTARENIRFWRAASGVSTQGEQPDDYALLGQLGLAGLEDVPCRTLSAGQQRRVSLARLWFSQRQLWILDEPFTALDQVAIAMLQQHFLVHLQQGGGIILTSHQSLSQVFTQLKSLELAYRW